MTMLNFQSPAPVDTDPCCSEAEVVALVQRFYAKVRVDSLLGPHPRLGRASGAPDGFLVGDAAWHPTF